MSTFVWVVTIILLVLLIAMAVLYFFGRKAEKKQTEQQKALEANAQTISLFVIDKKKMRLKDAGLPSVVLEQAPKLAKAAKIPIVKVKAGPRVMNLIADAKVYDAIMPKQEIKATVSGLYITSFKRIRGPVYEPPKKKGLFGKNK
ncbi:MAG: hypothetical protein K6G85_02710 [Eubacterium sp.]|nr:hypothetical protein [Eubacterium sp.]